MSLVFSDTSTKQGLVQEYEREIGLDYGDVSGNATLLAEFVSLLNQSLDDAAAIAVKSEGRWQWDDSNQTDYPIITTNLVLGQRDYTFTTDQDGNAILDVYKVFVASPAGIFREMQPVDVQTGDATPRNGAASGQLYTADSLMSFTNGQNASGSPSRYDKLGNSLFLDPIPNYNYPGGLKCYVNREASHFTSADTTKKPGFPGQFHKYFYLKPALAYARRNTLESYPRILGEVQKLEGDPIGETPGTIAIHFSRRSRDERPRLSTSRDSNR